MDGPALIKTSGYAISAVSVILLGIVTAKSAFADPLLAACLVGGIVTSIIGMALRWLSYRMDED